MSKVGKFLSGVSMVHGAAVLAGVAGKMFRNAGEKRRPHLKGLDHRQIEVKFYPVFGFKLTVEALEEKAIYKDFWKEWRTLNVEDRKQLLVQIIAKYPDREHDPELGTTRSELEDYANFFIDGLVNSDASIDDLVSKLTKPEVEGIDVEKALDMIGEYHDSAVFKLHRFIVDDLAEQANIKVPYDVGYLEGLYAKMGMRPDWEKIAEKFGNGATD